MSVCTTNTLNPIFVFIFTSHYLQLFKDKLINWTYDDYFNIQNIEVNINVFFIIIFLHAKNVS